jgi:hypothetical protein
VGTGCFIGQTSCQLADGGYTANSQWDVSFNAQTLMYSFCDAPSFEYRQGQRTLQASDMKTLQAALSQLRFSDRNTCGTDKPEYRLQIDSDAGVMMYKDSFWACRPEANTRFVTSIDTVFDELRKLSRPQ